MKLFLLLILLALAAFVLATLYGCSTPESQRPPELPKVEYSAQPMAAPAPAWCLDVPVSGVTVRK